MAKFQKLYINAKGLAFIQKTLAEHHKLEQFADADLMAHKMGRQWLSEWANDVVTRFNEGMGVYLHLEPRDIKRGHHTTDFALPADCYTIENEDDGEEDENV